MQPQNAESATKKRTRIPVITQSRFRDCFPVEFVICLSCEKVFEAPLDRDYEITCANCGGNQTQNHAEFLILKQIAPLDSFTLTQWIRLLPAMIANQYQTGNKQTAQLLESKLLTLQQL